VNGPELSARTLQISLETWQRVLTDYWAHVTAPAPGETVDDEIERCLAALASAYRPYSPHELPRPLGEPARVCPMCEALAVRPFVARRPDVTYGRCEACGHGLLLNGRGRAEEDVRALYRSADYYSGRAPDGVGYDDYDREAAYREIKGALLAERLRQLQTPPATLLEVGSGFGYTRAGAERAGLRTAGVDLNPHARDRAKQRYGFDTFVGTLAEALASPESQVPPGAWDAVLYQFVLEHVPDPVSELTTACRALRPGGWLALLVPSMEAAEIEAFGASYRSFRADHLHLFSRASIGAVLQRAGFVLQLAESFCNIHLLREVLSASALTHLYRSGRGPDFFVVARAST
jgi:SAM-dependent methyltransferase